MQPISIDTHFKTLQAFRLDCQNDVHLTPSAQLLFRLLVEQANSSRWTDTFIYPIDEIIKVSHLSRPTIIEARRLLKSKGYIDFTGNPSRYTVNSKVNCELNYSGTPTPPIINNKTKTKEERKERRKGGSPNAANNDHRLHHRPNHQTPQNSLQTEITRKLKSLGY